MTRQTGYNTRQAAYGLRELPGKGFVGKPGRTRRCHVPLQTARTIAAPLTCGILGSPRVGRDE